MNVTAYPTATALLDEIYASGEVRTPEGQAKLHSHISREEGQFLRNLIASRPGIEETLEIGCAYGLSSLWICSALKGHHTIIDPFQNAEWGGVGVANLKRAGIDYFSLIEERSEIALPKLLEQDKKFDLIFVDGFHTFDHVMVDCFYSVKLLRPGGFLVLDDTDMPSIARVVRHLDAYPCLNMAGRVHAGFRSRKARIVPNFIANRLSPRIQFDLAERYTLTAFKKRAEDKRAWNWHEDF